MRFHLWFLRSPNWIWRSVHNTPKSTLTICTASLGPCLNQQPMGPSPHFLRGHPREAGHTFGNSRLRSHPTRHLREDTPLSLTEVYKQSVPMATPRITTIGSSCTIWVTLLNMKTHNKYQGAKKIEVLSVGEAIPVKVRDFSWSSHMTLLGVSHSP